MKLFNSAEYKTGAFNVFTDQGDVVIDLFHSGLSHYSYKIVRKDSTATPVSRVSDFRGLRLKLKGAR